MSQYNVMQEQQLYLHSIYIYITLSELRFINTQKNIYITGGKTKNTWIRIHFRKKGEWDSFPQETKGNSTETLLKLK